MTMTFDGRLQALAERELEQLSLAPALPGSPLTELQRLEARAGALFLVRERDVDIAEVQQLLSNYSQSWLSFIRSEEPMQLWSGSSQPQADEHLMALCACLMNGLLESLASNRKAIVSEFYSRYLGRARPEIELSEATMILARQLLFVFNREFTRASDEIESSWDEWVEFNLVHPQDDLWTGLRGVARNEARLVHASLQGLANKRVVALRYAVESGLLLRSTLPAWLTLQTSSSALLRLAQSRGMAFPLDTEELLTKRALMLWRLG